MKHAWVDQEFEEYVKHYDNIFEGNRTYLCYIIGEQAPSDIFMHEYNCHDYFRPFWNKYYKFQLAMKMYVEYIFIVYWIFCMIIKKCVQYAPIYLSKNIYYMQLFSLINVYCLYIHLLRYTSLHQWMCSTTHLISLMKFIAYIHFPVINKCVLHTLPLIHECILHTPCIGE